MTAPSASCRSCARRALVVALRRQRFPLAHVLLRPLLVAIAAELARAFAAECRSSPPPRVLPFVPSRRSPLDPAA